MKVSVNIHFLWIAFLGLFLSCSSDQKNEFIQVEENYSQVLQGNTQGTTYTIVFSDSNKSITAAQVDSILHDFDLELSGYIETSLLSKWNSNEIISLPRNKYFTTCLNKSEEVFKSTQGNFDPTVFPLIKLWGFFKKDYSVPSANSIDSVLNFVGMDKIQINGDSLLKNDARLSLDFNAIAQGYAVDVVADYIKSNGYDNFYVEIGGELFVSGQKVNGEPWILGIDVPDVSNTPGAKRQVQKIIGVKDGKGIATSGDYRKSFEYEGKKYAHAINPSSGKPIQHSLLSVTVLANDAALADAYATAFLVMGTEQSMSFIEANQDLQIEAYFISSSEEQTYEEISSPGFEKYVLQ